MESVKQLVNDLDFNPNSLPNPLTSMSFPSDVTYEQTSSLGPDRKTMVQFNRPITSLELWSASEKSKRQTQFLVKYLGQSNFSKLLQTLAMYPVVKDIMQAFVVLLLKDGVTHFQVYFDKPPEYFEQRSLPLVPISLYYMSNHLLTGVVHELQGKPKPEINHVDKKIQDFYIFTYDKFLTYIEDCLRTRNMEPIIDSDFLYFISNPIIISFKKFIFPVLNKLCELNQYEETHEDVKNIDFIDLLTKKQPTPSEYQVMEQAPLPVEEFSLPFEFPPIADAEGLGSLDSSHDLWLSGAESPLGAAEAPLGAAEAPLGAAESPLGAAAESPLGAAEGAKKAVEEGLSEGLTYFHKKYPDLNSSITLYGENHSSNYTNFLKDYIEHLYESKRTNILIIELSPWDLQSDKDKFKDKVSNLKRTDVPLPLVLSPVSFLCKDNKEAKLLAVRLIPNPTPINYFNLLLLSDGAIPNTRIFCGDCRLLEFLSMYEEIDKLMHKVNEGEYSKDALVDENFLAKFISLWEKQLSIFKPLLDRKRSSFSSQVTSIFERYKKSVENITLALNSIKTMYDLQLQNEFVLKVEWVSLSNLHMLLTIIRIMKRNVDITLFVGKAHMNNLIQSIEEFPFEIYFEKQELERMEKTREITVQKAMTMRRNAGRSKITDDGSPFSLGGKRTRKRKQKRSTNKKCRIHKKRKRMSRRRV